MATLSDLYAHLKTLCEQWFYNKSEIDANKQDKLVSGTNIKTVNNNSLLGSGNISISSSGTVDSALSTTSTNPVENQAITNEINSLSDSITNIDTLHSRTIALSSNVWINGNNLYLYRIGKLVIAFIYSGQLKYTSTGWQNMITLPTGYRPRVDFPLAVINNATETFSQWRTSNNVLQVYCATANTTAYTGCFGVWVTNDDYPSE